MSTDPAAQTTVEHPAPGGPSVGILSVFGWFAAALAAGSALQALVLVPAANQLVRSGDACGALNDCLPAALAQPRVSAFCLFAMALAWVASAAIGARVGGGTLAQLRLRPCSRPLTTTLALLLGMLAIAYGGIACLKLAAVTPGSVLQLLGKLAGSATTSGWGAAVWVGLGVTGIAEEIFFRGYLQTRLERRWGAMAVLVAAALFGAVHWDAGHTPITFAEGLLLGAVARRTGSLLPGLAAHATQNLSARFLYPMVFAATDRPRCLGVIGVAILALGASLAALRQLQPRSRSSPS